MDELLLRLFKQVFKEKVSIKHSVLDPIFPIKTMCCFSANVTPFINRDRDHFNFTVNNWAICVREATQNEKPSHVCESYGNHEVLDLIHFYPIIYNFRTFFVLVVIPEKNAVILIKFQIGATWENIKMLD